MNEDAAFFSANSWYKGSRYGAVVQEGGKHFQMLEVPLADILVVPVSVTYSTPGHDEEEEEEEEGHSPPAHCSVSKAALFKS